MCKEENLKKLKFLLEHLDFEENVASEALNYISNNYSRISKMKEKAYVGDWDKYLLNTKCPYTMLMILIYSIVDLSELYIDKNLPLNIFTDTLSDLTLRQKTYFKKHHKLGLTEEDVTWLKHIYYLNIFKLGSLQYEIGNMSYLECTHSVDLKTKQKLPEDTPILKVHIRRGVDLSKHSVDESFKYSKVFFENYYPEYKYKAYTCNSWMLYSKNKIILSPESNILKFADRFELLCEAQRKDMAIKYIFETESLDIEDYPRKTSLQLNALKNLENLGVGYGVIYI